MELDIKDLAITVAIGATVLFGCEFVAWLFFRNNIYVRLRQHSLIPHHGSTALMLSLSLALGLIIESAADPSIRERLFKVSGFEEVMLEQLVSPEGQTMALGAEIAERRLFSRLDGAGGDRVEIALCNSTERTLPFGQFSRSAWRLYYHAKNVVLAHPTYSKEMLSIQQRIDFAAAFALGLAFMLLLLSAAFLLKLLTDAVRSGRAEPEHPFWGFDYAEQQFFQKGTGGFRYLARVSFGLVILAAGGLAASNYAYATQAGEYVRRAFGYYSTEAESIRQAQLRNLPPGGDTLGLVNRSCPASARRQRDA